MMWRSPFYLVLVLAFFVVTKLGAQTQGAPQNLDELLDAFESGLVVDLNTPDGVEAFALYRAIRFGNPRTSIPDSTIAAVFKKHPTITKPSFAEIEIDQVAFKYPSPKSLDQLIRQIQEANGKLKSKLYQPMANRGVWKKLGATETEEGLLTDADLEELFPQDIQKILANPKLGSTEKLDHLWPRLQKILESKKALGRDVRALVQIQADLIHLTAFESQAFDEGVRDSSALTRLHAIDGALERRFKIAEDHGIEGGVDKLLEQNAQKKIQGMPTEAVFRRDFAAAKMDVQKSRIRDDQNSIRWTSRPLSILEAPARSCIGGSDCSSRTYPLAAFDSSFGYFTRTNPRTGSTGHITVVLGEALDEATQQMVKVAFIDKIQNIPSEELPLRIEAARRALAEKNILLGLKVDEDSSDHNGLSNNALTTSEVIRRYLKNSDQPRRVLKSFSKTPSSTPIEYATLDQKGYSRAEQSPNLVVVPALAESADWKMATGETHESYRAAIPSMEELKASAFALKTGTVVERIKYIHLMRSLLEAKIEADPEFKNILSVWASQPEFDSALRTETLDAAAIYAPEAVIDGLKSMKRQDREAWIDRAEQRAQSPDRMRRFLKENLRSLVEMVESEALAVRLVQVASLQEKLNVLKNFDPQTSSDVDRRLAHLFDLDFQSDSNPPRLGFPWPADNRLMDMILRYRALLIKENRLGDFSPKDFLSTAAKLPDSIIARPVYEPDLVQIGGPLLVSLYEWISPETEEEKSLWRILGWHLAPDAERILDEWTSAKLHPIFLTVFDVGPGTASLLRKFYYQEQPLHHWLHENVAEGFLNLRTKYGLQIEELGVKDRVRVLVALAEDKGHSNLVTPELVRGVFDQLEKAKREGKDNIQHDATMHQLKLLRAGLPVDLAHQVIESDVMKEKGDYEFRQFAIDVLPLDPPHQGYRDRYVRLIETESRGGIGDDLVNFASAADGFHAIPQIHSLLMRVVDPREGEKPVYVGLLMRILSFGKAFLDANPEVAPKIWARIESDWTHPDIKRRVAVMRAFSDTWANHLHIAPTEILYSWATKSLETMGSLKPKNLSLGDPGTLLGKNFGWDIAGFLEALETFRQRQQENTLEFEYPAELKAAVRKIIEEHSEDLRPYLDGRHPNLVYLKILMDREGISLRPKATKVLAPSLEEQIQSHLKSSPKASVCNGIARAAWKFLTGGL